MNDGNRMIGNIFDLYFSSLFHWLIYNQIFYSLQNRAEPIFLILPFVQISFLISYTIFKTDFIFLEYDPSWSISQKNINKSESIQYY